MGPLKNPRHEKFAAAVASGRTLTDAYIEAGFDISESAAGSAGSRLRQNPAVDTRIKELSAVESGRFSLTKDWIISEMVDTAKEAKVDRAHSARSRALELLGREKGAFTERAEYTIHSFDQMDSDQIEAFLAGERAKGITPAVGGSGRSGTGKAKGRQGKPRGARSLAG